MGIFRNLQHFSPLLVGCLLKSSPTVVSAARTAWKPHLAVPFLAANLQLSTMANSADAENGACANGNTFRFATWNIAAINNNPFEYWITHEDERYNLMMKNVQEYIIAPGDRDVPVKDVFTDEMFAELRELMEIHGWDKEAISITQTMWDEDYKMRKIVTEFMQDDTIGNKRLASMPDRITNTINVAGGSQVFRPTPINCYGEKFASFADWWGQWKRFMFDTPITVMNKGQEKQIKVADLLIPIKKAKYPAVTEEEEKASIPLQTVCGAIFDAILIHMLDSIAPFWQDLRHEMVAALNRNKSDRILEILNLSYSDMDVVFLQEVANAFAGSFQRHHALDERYHVVVPVTSGKRDQNSVLLISKSKFDIGTVQDVTELVSKRFEGTSVPVAEGDLVAVTVRSSPETGSIPLLFASFHGDTNGLATIPVIDAVHEVAQGDLGGEFQLVFGMDANTYTKGKPGKTQDVSEFVQYFEAKGLSSCWGPATVPGGYTTYNARTYLQPQLNKAATREEFLAKGDVNPKDFILFYRAHFAAQDSAVKDNTGDKTFVEDQPFPTLKFPSDHAVLSSTLKTV